MDASHRVQCLVEEPSAETTVGESLAGRLDLHRDQLRRIETGIDREQPLQAPEKQSGAHEQRQRERDFGHDERATSSLAA